MLIRSIFVVGAIHALSAILTFVQIIYLTRVLGVEGWGSIVYLQLFVNYLIWLSNWGFYLHTTKKISNCKNDLKKINRIFSETILSQFLLTIISLSLAALFIFVSTNFLNKMFTFYIVLGLLISNLIQPLWLLNGLEKVSESAVIQVFNKLFLLIFILFLIDKPSDAPKFFIINFFTSFMVGICFLFWIKSKYKIRLVRIKFVEIRNEIKISSHLFFSMIWANITTTLIPIMIGTISGSVSLGYYSLADRIRSSLLQLLHPVILVLFPRLCFLFKSNPIEARRLLIKAGSLILIFSLLCSIFIYFLSSTIIHRMSGPSFDSSVSLLKIMSFTIPLMVISDFVMYQVLIPSGRYSVHHNSRLFILIFSLLFSYPTIVYGGVIGAAWISLIIELALVIFVIYSIRHSFNNKDILFNTRLS